MIPAYFTNELAKKILQTGKSVNFIRRCCQLQGWTLHMSTQSLFDLENGLDINRLQQWVNEACEKTNSELLSIIFSKYHFEQHCLYLKKYLLLGQGDLMEYLMDLMNDVLEKPAKQIYKQQLRSILDTAIRSSNAQYHPQEFISRLDVKLLEGSQGGDRGWDVFLLEYQVDDVAPLQTIFTAEVMRNYLKIFHFLWKLKRVQHYLSVSWGLNMANQAAFRKIKGSL
jgi:gamma-tubulin complex component 3